MHDEVCHLYSQACAKIRKLEKRIAELERSEEKSADIEASSEQSSVSTAHFSSPGGE